MARMAILQVIVPEDDPARIGELMERAAQVLKDAGIAIAVRSADSDGAPMTGDVPWRAKLALHQGAFDEASAWPDHFVLPFDRVYATDVTGEGTLTIRVHSCVQAPGAIQGDIDLKVEVTEDGVRTSLFPRGVYRNVRLNDTRAHLDFEEAALQQGAKASPAAPGSVGRLFDAATGRQIVGPALSVVAVGRYGLAEATAGGGYRLSGVVLDNYHDHTATQIVDRRIGGTDEALFFTDQGHIVPASRLELRVASTASGG